MSKMKIDSKALAEIIADKMIKGELDTLDISTLTAESVFEDSVSEAPKEEVEIIKPKLELDPKLYKEIGDCFMVQEAIHKLLTRNVTAGVNTMLLGPTGVGKTELVANIAREMDLPLTIFDMGTMTDPIMSLVGTHAIDMKDGVTSSTFKRSRFSQVIQQPGIVLLDEISRASAAANNLLFPVLDFRRTLAMEYDFSDSTPVAVHPECVFISTANLGSQYTGTHKLDRALVDRFMTIEIDPLGTESIKAIVKHNFPEIKIAQRKKIVECYDSINAAHDEYKISFNLSLRHLKLICGMVVDGFTIYDSFYMICKGVGNKDGVKAIEEILNSTK